MLNNTLSNSQNDFDRENLVQEVIKYRIKKYGDCGLKLIFTTFAGEFYKNQSITKFDGSLLNTCEQLINSQLRERIAVDGIYNSMDNTFKAKPYLVFKNSIAAASLEYIENVDFRNENLDNDVKLCIINAIINSAASNKLLNPDYFTDFIDVLADVNPLSYKIDLKNTLTLLEFMANNIKYYIKKKSSYLGKSDAENSKKLDPKNALAELKKIIYKYERLDNNDLIMAVYRVSKGVKEFDVEEVNYAFEII